MITAVRNVAKGILDQLSDAPTQCYVLLQNKDPLIFVSQIAREQVSGVACFEKQESVNKFILLLSAKDQRIARKHRPTRVSLEQAREIVEQYNSVAPEVKCLLFLDEPYTPKPYYVL